MKKDENERPSCYKTEIHWLPATSTWVYVCTQVNIKKKNPDGPIARTDTSLIQSTVSWHKRQAFAPIVTPTQRQLNLKGGVASGAETEEPTNYQQYLHVVSPAVMWATCYLPVIVILKVGMHYFYFCASLVLQVVLLLSEQLHYPGSQLARLSTENS